jgi:hypothetical protein
MGVDMFACLTNSEKSVSYGIDHTKGHYTDTFF